jgi:acetylornithine aminotransferase
MLASGKAAGLMQPGNHGSTFGGNPLSCAAALAAVTEIVDGGMDKRAAALGDRMISNLRGQLADTSHVMDIRGRGCMIGIELDKPCKSLFMAAMEKGLIINVTADSVIRLLPPFIMSDDEADQLVDILVPLIKDFDKD